MGFPPILAYLAEERYKKGNTQIVCGKVLPEQTSGKLFHCSLKCLSKLWCDGILFNSYEHYTNRCKLIFPACAHVVNLNNWYNFTHYKMKPGLYRNKNNKCNFNIIGDNVSEKWDLPCPTLYFNLDSAIKGTTGDKNSTAIRFPESEILGSMFHLPNPDGNIRANFDLGHYPRPEFCYPIPGECSEGTTLSFWLNVLHEMNAHQAFISTMNNKGPGIVIWLNTANDFVIVVRRGSDSTTEKSKISNNIFNYTFGFGKWFHIAVSYKFDGSNLGNNIDVYMNGYLWVDLIKTSYGFTKEANYSANMKIGKFYLDGNSNNLHSANMKLDELFLWEKTLSNDKIYKLYDSYDWVN